MKAEYINPFLKASSEVLKTLTGMEFNVGKPYMVKSPLSSKEVIIILGITGEIKGQTFIVLDEEMAKRVASKMMMGMPVESLDEMAKSAISELGNMIMGNAATLLYNNGTNIDITPPTLMIGENLKISTTETKTLCVPLTSELGDLDINLSTKDR